MANRLYIVHGSHPAATVEKALQIKGVPYKVVEITPPMHVPVMRMLFGGRTVPAIRFDDGTKLQGSRAILAELERRVPAPALYGASPEERARIEEAERWGDEVLQPLGRRLVWPALRRSAVGMHSMQAGQRMPKLPLPVVRAAVPVVVGAEMKLNKASWDTVRNDLQTLAGCLDHVDALIAEGVLGGDAPNAADLQIATTLRLLMAVGDVRPLIAARPAGALALKWLEPLGGNVPAGIYPAEWAPAATA